MENSVAKNRLFRGPWQFLTKRDRFLARIGNFSCQNLNKKKTKNNKNS